MKENRKGAYLHHDKVSCNSTKTKCVGRPPHSKTFKNVLQTAVNKEQAFNVPFHFFYFIKKTVI